MKPTIYTCREDNELWIKEKFEVPIDYNINDFVWRLPDRSLGFNNGEMALVFVKTLLQNSFTILFPSLVYVDNDIEKHIHNLKGITFFDNIEELKNEYDALVLFKEKEKKNLLLQRYNKPIETLTEPVIKKWFNSNSGMYTKEFTDYCISKNLKFIVWAYSDWNIYFYSFETFNEINEIVRSAADKLEIELKKVNDVTKMPYH
ncbi:hypothetical protein [Mucilaginibacter sp. OK098]|uniref:hypothetical protein n=1 Tax=Mucilaginibacter sp. OK098 TaxID=1855297 RepID=UPI00090F9611|nr:hypothetical protein [Mucilaginibacter sp. OK098]SHM67374.1 hypothetical protein SAMN05216524_1034 [Mucilaginibacter sp. OK098]